MQGTSFWLREAPGTSRLRPSRRLPAPAPFLSLTLGALLALAPGCAAPDGSGELEALYRASANDLGGGSPSEQEAAEDRRSVRMARVRELLDEGAELTNVERLYAAALLLDSAALEDLARAQDLALQAAAAGEDRGFPLAAEAIDRQLLTLGRPQRYGTQYVWSASTATWALYPTDPVTGDVERRAMGLVSLAEARARASLLPPPD